MPWSDNARTVLERRYLARDEQGRVTETIEDLFHRVADAVAQADAAYDANADVQQLASAFYESMMNQEFMPNSPTLMNAGRPLGQLSACFVLPVPDTMDGIFDAVKNAALIHKSGGGTGFSFSRLRPKGAAVASTGGVASGPVSFMRVFNTATEAVKQGGTRRGANMGVLRVDHPDVREFIACKADTTEFTNFNISVGLTEAFMNAAIAGETYALRDPRTGEPVGTEDAREIFDLIVEMAWRNGEPGILFLDRMNRDNVTPELGEIESTNPCGEQPLLPFESCNLGSIQLTRFLKRTRKGVDIDEERLGACVDLAVHFLDNVIDINRYPLEEIDRQTKATRKIGLGVMGFADMLFEMGVAYDSDEGCAVAERVMGFIQARSKRASRELAKVRGAFPAFAQSVWKDGEPLRNATTTTIAPTGTISILCGASSGVEPLFALSFVRNVMDNDALPETNAAFLEVARQRGLATRAFLGELAQRGTLHGMDVPEEWKRVFVTAHDISPEAHVRMQAAFQRHTDNAVSKTVNFRREATRDDVRAVYRLAYELGCKGITLYRDGSRDAQVLSVGTGEAKDAKDAKGAMDAALEPVAADDGGVGRENGDAGKPGDGACAACGDPADPDEGPTAIKPRPRPEVTMGITEKVRIGCGNLYVTVNYDEKGICEVFTNLGRAGGCPSQSEATSRLVSVALRSGMDVHELIEQLRGIRCHSTLRSRDNGIKVLSCPDAIGRVLEKVIRIREQQGYETPPPPISGAKSARGDRPRKVEAGCIANCSLCQSRADCDARLFEEPGDDRPAIGTCPDCNGAVEHDGGCIVCRSCGYSKCN